jgi:phage terminase large subunit GpA-like protein
MQTLHPLAHPRNVTRDIAALVRAPRQMKPSESAALYLRNNRGPWDPTVAPELVEPMDMLSSREYRGIIYVGPARSSKTYSLVLGAFEHNVVCDPGDMLIVQMSRETARDFSRTEVDRVIRHSPEILARLSPRAKDDNTFDKFFRDGQSLKIGWPAISQLSSKTLRTVIITDYDRPKNRDDVDGEGPIWSQAFKRIETYMSRGKCIAESSPGEEITDANWKPQSPHEAPHVAGILSLYNQGTRARRYWPCKHCGEFFESKPGPEAFNLPAFEELEALLKRHDPMTLADKFAFIYCPSCGGEHAIGDRAQMRRLARWVHEGETIDVTGAISGTRRRSDIVSYWQAGVTAAYQRWDSMLLKYFQGIAAYTTTGDETQLKATVFTDFAAPYLSRLQAKRRTPEQFESRLEELERGVVPDWVRFLTAAVDTQAHSFRVNVMGWGPGLESVLIERFSIETSKRTDSSGRQLGLDPAAYVEDWECLVSEVIHCAYPVAGIDGLKIAPQLVLVDSGGRDGVTTRAYEFWRSLRRRGMGERLKLIKGEGKKPGAPRTSITYPDNRSRGDRHAAARGDVPVILLNVNLLKDAITGDLNRTVPGPGYVHLPNWVEPEFFLQMTAEVRNAKGIWENPKKQRNEDFDLHCYSRGGCIVLNAEKMNWDAPPPWAMPLKSRPRDGAQAKTSTVADLARGLNG